MARVSCHPQRRQNLKHSKHTQKQGKLRTKQDSQFKSNAPIKQEQTGSIFFTGH